MGQRQLDKIPKLCDRLTELPVLLWIKTSIDGYLNEWYFYECLPKHLSERDENAMVKTWPHESTTITTARFGFIRQTRFLASLNYADEQT
jgi:hypothetical protein